MVTIRKRRGNCCECTCKTGATVERALASETPVALRAPSVSLAPPNTAGGRMITPYHPWLHKTRRWSKFGYHRWSILGCHFEITGWRLWRVLGSPLSRPLYMTPHSKVRYYWRLRRIRLMGNTLHVRRNAKPSGHTLRVMDTVMAGANPRSHTVSSPKS